MPYLCDQGPGPGTRAQLDLQNGFGGLWGPFGRTARNLERPAPQILQFVWVENGFRSPDGHIWSSRGEVFTLALFVGTTSRGHDRAVWFVMLFVLMLPVLLTPALYFLGGHIF